MTEKPTSKSPHLFVQISKYRKQCIPLSWLCSGNKKSSKLKRHLHAGWKHSLCRRSADKRSSRTPSGSFLWIFGVGKIAADDPKTFAKSNILKMSSPFKLDSVTDILLVLPFKHLVWTNTRSRTKEKHVVFRLFTDSLYFARNRMNNAERICSLRRQIYDHQISGAAGTVG